MPQDHFYRRLERTLDLSFVRELVEQTYAQRGRPSIDRARVLAPLQLVMFFEGIRSERQLMRHAADRLSIRWFLGYDLGEPLPDHSSLTKIRTRYGLEVFRRFFDAIVEQCQEAGLVWGRELYVNGTKVAANAGKESVKPREAREAHLSTLFDTQAEKLVDEELLDRVRAYQLTEAYKKALRKRQVWVEPLFARSAKTGMVCAGFACAGTGRVNCEALMRAAGQNLKHLLKKRGWGRHPFPVEALCAFFLASYWRLTSPCQVYVFFR